MKHNLLKILTALAVIILFNRCAQIGVLNGGPRDQTPPKLLEATPELKSLQFNSALITLKFDENIQLRDLNNQLVISPKLKTKPEIIANGKKLTIKLVPEELLPNTTYRFYFGKSIADMHEGNPLTNFSYIISTGTIIDSLNIKGTVTNALDQVKEKDLVVGLYFNKNLTDSFAFKNTPDYVTRTNEYGQFELNNLPKDEFKLICFTDKNKDYLYNGADNEQISFLSEDIKLQTDSSFKLNLFKEIPTKTYIKKVIMSENGKGLVLFNQKTVSNVMSFIDERSKDVYQLHKDRESDTCEFFYKQFKDTIWLKVGYGNGTNKLIDTLKLKVPVLKYKYRQIIKTQSDLLSGKLGYNNDPVIALSQWIDTSKTDLKRIHLYSKTDTSVNRSPVKIKWMNGHTFKIENTIKPKQQYFLKIDTACFIGYNGSINDSIKFPFTKQSKSELGSLILKVTFNKKQSYVVQLINSANKIVKERNVSFSLSASNTTSITFKDMEEDTYKIRIIYDDNEDKVWNTGNYLKSIQPEKTYIFEKGIKILPDWEIEEEFILRE
ncbi:MAG: Ig-like domain-containing protein [Sphingobacteriaceae bacterium]|jgi:hypothetical protein